MFASTRLELLRPRFIKYTPPPLARRMGDFKCRKCKFRWHSEHVWVTQASQVCYQGQMCEKCGSIEKPYYIGNLRGEFPGKDSNSKKWKSHNYATMNKGRGG